LDTFIKNTKETKPFTEKKSFTEIVELMDDKFSFVLYDEKLNFLWLVVIICDFSFLFGKE
jgi:hypothetical protein